MCSPNLVTRLPDSCVPHPCETADGWMQCKQHVSSCNLTPPCLHSQAAAFATAGQVQLQYLHCQFVAALHPVSEPDTMPFKFGFVHKCGGGLGEGERLKGEGGWGDGYWTLRMRSLTRVPHHQHPLRSLCVRQGGGQVCLTVTIVDGLVLARSGFHHDINTRSVVALGQATLVSDAAVKSMALDAIIDHACPGRAADLGVRAASAGELSGRGCRGSWGRWPCGQRGTVIEQGRQLGGGGGGVGGKGDGAARTGPIRPWMADSCFEGVWAAKAGEGFGGGL